MKIAGIDLAIILLYLASTIFLGLYFKKRAQKSKNDYLLGGNTVPWYMLGLSNASGMFDISGTMWLVTLLFVYGLKSIWIPWLWPVFNQVFLMVFLSMWLRKSNVTTGAEWLHTRFGYNLNAKLAHGVIVVFAIILGLGYLAYGFVGIGKFIEIFIPWEWLSQYIPFDISERYVPHFYGLLLTCFAVFYTLLGGMLSIVWTDVIQYGLMAVSAIIVGVLAMNGLSESNLVVPDGWMTPFFGSHLDIDWSTINAEVNSKIASDGYSLFSLFFGMMLFKGILVSLAGPAPTYDMQKILSTRSPREAALMSGSVSLILMPLRYFMIAGFAVLALLNYDKLDLIVSGKVDFEQVLPSAIQQFVPPGWMGLLLAGLLAAFMGTFAGTLNATQAYIVNDIYLKYIKPDAPNSKIATVNYMAGIIMISISIVLGLFAGDVNSLLQWIVSGLYGSYVAANLLKWYWWRFNASGFFWGMVFGLLPALTFPYIFEGTLDLYYFPLMLLLSSIACIAGTLLTEPTDDATLMAFYKRVQPWGFWGPIKAKVLAEDPSFVPNTNFGKDMFNVGVGVIWQTALVAFPIYLVLSQVVPTIVCISVAIVGTIILKKNWYDKLPTDV